MATVEGLIAYLHKYVPDRSTTVVLTPQDAMDLPDQHQPCLVLEAVLEDLNDPEISVC